jgi:hypothetical protein
MYLIYFVCAHCAQPTTLGVQITSGVREQKGWIPLIYRIRCFKVLSKRLHRWKWEKTAGKAERRVRLQHVKRNTAKYEKGRSSQQAVETASIEQQSECHIRTETVEHWPLRGNSGVERAHIVCIRTGRRDECSWLTPTDLGISYRLGNV